MDKTIHVPQSLDLVLNKNEELCEDITRQTIFFVSSFLERPGNSFSLCTHFSELDRIQVIEVNKQELDDLCIPPKESLIL